MGQLTGQTQYLGRGAVSVRLLMDIRRSETPAVFHCVPNLTGEIHKFRRVYIG